MHVCLFLACVRIQHLTVHRARGGNLRFAGVDCVEMLRLTSLTIFFEAVWQDQSQLTSSNELDNINYMHVFS